MGSRDTVSRKRLCTSGCPIPQKTKYDCEETFQKKLSLWNLPQEMIFHICCRYLSADDSKALSTTCKDMRSAINVSFCLKSVPFSHMLKSHGISPLDEIVSGKYILALQSDDFEFQQSNSREVSKYVKKLNLSQLKCFRARDIYLGTENPVAKFADHEHLGYIHFTDRARSTREFDYSFPIPLSKEYFKFVTSVCSVAKYLQILELDICYDRKYAKIIDSLSANCRSLRKVKLWGERPWQLQKGVGRWDHHTRPPYALTLNYIIEKLATPLNNLELLDVSLINSHRCGWKDGGVNQKRVFFIHWSSILLV